MTLSKHFKTVKDLEKAGVPVEYGENSKGKTIKFYIARSGGANLEYLTYLDVLAKPHRRLIENGTADNKVLEKLLRKAFLEKGLKGWENVEAEWEPQYEMEIDGEQKFVYPDLPFTRENAEKLYDFLPDLYSDHQKLSSQNAMYLDEVRKAEAKN
jgi:hypothetical protein